MGLRSSNGRSARLRAKLDLVSAPFGRAIERLVGHPRLGLVLPEYFTRAHCVIRATVPLMEAVAERAEALPGTDPVAADLARYLRAHAAEELHHDDWLLDDLEAMGVDRATVLGRVPSATVARLVGAQYYWAFHFHPVALLGYLAAMEGFPPSVTLVEQLVERSGHPPDAFRTLAYHGRVDLRHRADLDRLLDALPMTPARESLIGLSAVATMETLTQSIDDVTSAGAALPAAAAGRVLPP